MQSISEAERQKWYFDRKANVLSLEIGEMVLAKANAYRGKRKVKDQWEEEPYEVEQQVAKGVPSYIMKNQQTGCSQVLHLSSLLQRGLLSVWACELSGLSALPSP